MADRARALALIDIVERHASILAELVPARYEAYETDLKLRLAVERALQVGIEALVDLAAITVADLRLGLPSDEESLVKRLAREKVLGEPDASTLAELRRFRNVLVHRYGALDDALVHDHALRAPEDLRRLAQAFRRALA